MNDAATFPLPSVLQQQVRRRAEDWLKGQKALELRAELLSVAEAWEEVQSLFLRPGEGSVSIDDVMRYFLVDYLSVGTESGHSLRLDLMSTIVRCDLDDDVLGGADRIAAVRQIRHRSPEAFFWMLRLANAHAEICREALRTAFGSDTLKLKRGVQRTDVHHAIESWAYRGSVKSYGERTLTASVPLSSVLSVRGQEHEVIVLRHRWESSIRVGTSHENGSEVADEAERSWRDRLADHLENVARTIRQAHRRSG